MGTAMKLFDRWGNGQELFGNLRESGWTHLADALERAWPVLRSPEPPPEASNTVDLQDLLNSLCKHPDLLWRLTRHLHDHPPRIAGPWGAWDAPVSTFIATGECDDILPDNPEPRSISRRNAALQSIIHVTEHESGWVFHGPAGVGGFHKLYASEAEATAAADAWLREHGWHLR